MNGAWDKWAWIAAVAADSRLTVGARFVLTQMAFNWTAVDRPTYRVRQATIAERLSVSLRLVKSAIAEAKGLGYIAVEIQRKRGAGQHGADLNRMKLPDLSANPAPHSELGAGDDGVGCTDCTSEVHETSELGARANAPTSENDVPNGSSKALVRALGGAPASAAPPSPRCPKHLNDESVPGCWDCRDARLAAEAWHSEHEQQEQARRAAIRAAINACHSCDDYGRDDNLRDCPEHPNFRAPALEKGTA